MYTTRRGASSTVVFLARPASCAARPMGVCNAALLPVLVALAVLAIGCEGTSGSGDGGSPARYQVLAGASEVTVLETCEGSGLEGEADVYHWVELLGAGPEDEEFTLLNDSTNRLVQLGLNESTHLGLANTNAYLDASDGYQLMFAIEAYENDPEGPSVENAREIVWEYDGMRGCWWRTDQGDSSLEAPCTSVPVEAGYETIDSFWLYDEAEFCEVRFRLYLWFRRVDTELSAF